MKKLFVITFASLLCVIGLMGINIQQVDAEQYTKLDEKIFSSEEMQEIANFVDADIIRDVSCELGETSTNNYVKVLLEKDASLADKLKTEFHVVVE